MERLDRRPQSWCSSPRHPTCGGTCARPCWCAPARAARVTGYAGLARSVSHNQPHCRHSYVSGKSVPAEHKGLGMTPKQVVKTWVERFNAGDAMGLAELYHDDAINHQVTQEPVEGR